MVRHRKPLLKMKEQKTDDPPSAHQKSYGPPFQLIKKVVTHPHILPPPPQVEIMNGPQGNTNIAHVRIQALDLDLYH